MNTRILLSFARFLLQLALLWGISWGCNAFVNAFKIPIPGNVLGVLVLFLLLCLGVLKIEHIKEAADFLLKHLVFFFIPITVGLMNCWDIFYAHWLVFLIAIVVSSLLPLWAVGFLSQRLHKEDGGV
jgi:holin-like protein